MSSVAELLSLCLTFGLKLLERLDGKKASDFRAAVLADAGTQWVRHMGGTDTRSGTGDACVRAADTGSHRD